MRFQAPPVGTYSWFRIAPIRNYWMRFEVPTDVNIKITDLWDVTPRSLVDRHCLQEGESPYRTLVPMRLHDALP